MTYTIKNSPEMSVPGKAGAPSRNSENMAGKSSRSNPVCLEVAVAIRSIPVEGDGTAKAILEESRTVIVFDNGAVLRSALEMPIGLKLILTHPSGREIACQVVPGHNSPSLKGYLEIEFLEAVNDFWGIHRDFSSAEFSAPPPAPAPTPPRQAPVLPPPAPSRAAALSDASAKPSSVVLGKGPKVENAVGLTSTPLPIPASRDLKADSATQPGLEKKMAKADSGYNLSEVAKPTPLANWDLPATEPPTENPAIPINKEASAIASPAPAQTHDFLSKGLMAYAPANASAGASNGRNLLIVGVAALALAGVCAVVFLMHRTPTHAPVANTAAVSQPSTPDLSNANTPPEPAPAAPDEAAPAASQETQAQPVAVDQAPPASAIAPVPAVVTGPATTDPPAESRAVRRQEKAAVVPKPPPPDPPRSPVIPNLKMRSPSSPNRSSNEKNDGGTPIAENFASTGGVPSAGLLTSAGRTSIPPTPPPAALAPAAAAPVYSAKSVREPKLISAPRPVYPEAAKQTNIEGSVTVAVSIDAKGNVVAAQALSGPVLLREAAEDAVRKWKYSPAMVDEKPAPSQITVGVAFKLK